MLNRVRMNQNARLLVAAGMCVSSGALQAQTFDATRLDGRPIGHSLDSGGFDPLIDVLNFNAVGLGTGADQGNNINGPSLIRLPDWLAAKDRVDPNANYYMYFANHTGDSIRMAWANSLTGDWHLFNYGTATDRSWGASGSNTGSQTLGNGVLDLDINNAGSMPFSGPGGFSVGDHIASPDVYIDSVNQRFVMYFHGPNDGDGPNGQQSYVSTSSNGLNFNTFGDGGQAGHGPRDVILTESYLRSFIVSGQTFAFSNQGELWKAPATNGVGATNTIANADTEGGLWNPVGSPNSSAHYWQQMDLAHNPLEKLYTDNGQGADDPRHVAIYQRTHVDPSDTNIYLFYSAKFDSPESIFLTVIDTNNGSVDTGDWTAIGQRVILAPTLDWEGADQPLGVSSGGAQINARELRDPAIFEDIDGKVYLLYTGEGEEAIGISELTFNAFASNLSGPQGDLGLVPEPGSAVLLVMGMAGALTRRRRRPGM